MDTQRGSKLVALKVKAAFRAALQIFRGFLSDWLRCSREILNRNDRSEIWTAVRNAAFTLAMMRIEFSA